MNKRTSSLFRVDEQAWLTMGVVCLIALVILAFRFGTTHPCYPIRILSTAPSFSVGTPVSFKAETRVGKIYEWNFGDGAGATENDPVTLHTYGRAGKYTVVVTIDGQCSEMQVVNIGEAPVVINYNLPPHIICADTAYVGVPTTYEDGNAGSSAWAWRFDGSLVSSFSQRTSHIWSSPGTRNVLLTTNNRNDLTDHRLIVVIDKKAGATSARPPRQRTEGSNRPLIVVNDRPNTPPLTQVDNKPKEPEKAPEVTKAPPVSDEKLQVMLFQVVDGNLVQDDFAQYICNNMNLPVMYNGSKTTFSAMCADLKNQKRKKIKKITVGTTKDGTNCILTMDVVVEKKKSFLGL
ncbi:MAG TPA: PKD domain-containing protein [Puia sp.]|jgi:hypothetical protein|nr:PKD domain-containing protein [Puia sp.]